MDSDTFANIDRAPMKRDQPNIPKPKDTPATRRKRLEDRLQEINAKNDQELKALARSLNRIKRTFSRRKKPETK